jgi:hypothetical protein
VANPAEFNPYSPPETTSPPDPLDVASREIGSVIRVFRWVGSAGHLILGLILTAFCVNFYNDPNRISTLEAVAPVIFCAGLLLNMGFFRIATALANRNESVRRPARLMSCILLLGFPLFTIIGVICLWKIGRHFDIYCRAASDDEKA